MEGQSSAWKMRETTQLVHKMQNPSSVIVLGSIRPYSMAKLNITVQMMILFFFIEGLAYFSKILSNYILYILHWLQE